MIAEGLEFQISQYVDGTLSAAQTKYVEDLVRSDAEAQKVLADYRRLNSQLAQHCTGPSVQWDRFAGQISDEIERADRPVVAGRIGFLQSRWRVAAAVLVAGSALMVARIALHSSHTQPTPAAPSISEVTGPQVEVAKGPAVQDVSISPSPALVARNGSRYGEGVISQGPPKVVILGQLPKPPADSPLH